MFGRHHIIRPAIGLARDDRDFRHCRLAIGEQQLGAMLDDAVEFLIGARQETGNIDEGDDGDIEGVTEPHEPRRLDRAVDIEAPGQHHRLVGDNADRMAFHAAEPGQDIGGKAGLGFEEIAFIDDLQNQFTHVIGFVRVGRHQRIERHFLPVERIVRRPHRRRLFVIVRHETHEPAQLPQGVDIVLERLVGNAGAGCMRNRPAQLLGRDHLVGDRFNDLRPGNEHVGAVFHHEDEIGHGGRIYRAAGARPHDHGNLRHHAARQNIALEDIGIAGKRGDAFLDARATAVIQPDDRRADLHRLIHDLADFSGMCG